MKKLIITCIGVGSIASSYAVRPQELVDFLKEVYPQKITEIYQDKRTKDLSVQDKLELLNLGMYHHIILADYLLAENADKLVTTPWAQFLCPRIQGDRLRQFDIHIGSFDPLALETILDPVNALLDLSDGLMRNQGEEDTSSWTLYANSSDLEQLNQYRRYFTKMGPLAEIYLEACEHPDDIILPVMPEGSITLAYPMDTDTSPYKTNEAGESIPNEAFFIEWNKRIQARFTSDTNITQALGSIMEILPLKEETDAILSNLRKGQLSNSSQCTVLFNLLDRLSRGREFFLHFAPLFLTR